MAKSNTAATAAKPKQIDRRVFTAKAEPLAVKVGGDAALVATVKEFQSGSVGWYAGGKIVVMVDGKPLSCQVGINITVVGSKE
jgi:hypothetical protein